jgi:putative ABC transport system permease protein
VNLFKLALAYLRARALASALQVLLLAIGLAAIVVMLLVTAQMAQRVERDTRGIDLVVGAKGSPLQLVLSAVFHVDTPTGNVRYEDALALAKHPLVRKAIPLALGDTWRGYRIVGTEHALVAHYDAQLAQGALWKDDMQAVVGALAARAGGQGGAPLKVGDTIVGSHGLVESGSTHDEHPYEVVGILAPTGTVIDRLVLVSIGSVWEVHEHDAPTAAGSKAGGAAAAGAPAAKPATTGAAAGASAPAGPAPEAAPAAPAETRKPHRHDHAHGHRHARESKSAAGGDRAGAAAGKPAVSDPGSDPGAAAATATTEPPREVTAVLVQYASPLAAAQLPRLINAGTAMQAASPAVESARLTGLVGVGVDALQVFAWVLIGAAGLALFITMYGALSERSHDLAMLRMLGASRGTLLRLLLIEGLLLCAAGGVLGLVLGHGLTQWLGSSVPALQNWALTGWVWLPEVSGLLLLALAIGAFASILPAVLAYRMDIAKVLARS